MDTLVLMVLLPGLFDPVPHECNNNQTIRENGRIFSREHLALDLDGGEWTSACEGDTVRLKCPHGEVIKVHDAEYGRSDTETCSSLPHPISCWAKASFDILHQRCEGKRKCFIRASNDEFGDPCPGIKKLLRVKYSCEKVVGEWLRSAAACEGTEMSLRCPAGTVLVVEDALYGRTDENICQEHVAVLNKKCSSEKALSVVRDRCHLKPNCSVVASNFFFGDPCPYTLKYLKAEYKCSAVFWDIKGRKSATICPSCDRRISCPNGKLIQIVNAWYTGSPPLSLSCEEKSKPICESDNALDAVSRSCNNKEECIPLSHQNMVDDDCVRPQKDLEVEFDCVDGQEDDKKEKEHYDEHFTREQRSPGEVPRTETVCERGRKRISCGEGQVISVEGAEYGRRDRTTCLHSEMKNVRCGAENSLSIVSEMCNGKKECDLEATNSIFGDPCHGTHKYLHVQFSCVSELKEPIKTHDTYVLEEIIDEHRMKTLQCPSGSTIKIVDAAYGKDSCRAKESFRIVSSQCNNKESCRVYSKNEVFGDPCVGILKQLIVKFQCKTVFAEVRNVAMAEENNSAHLTCPVGTSVLIHSAFYGMIGPKRQGGYSTQCISDNAFSIVSLMCNMQRKCVVPATNDIFSDPCPGTKKKLTVKYECVQEEQFQYKEIREGQSASLSCPKRSSILISDALYGIPDGLSLDPMYPLGGCTADQASNIVSARCNRMSSCHLSSTNAVFGDPCPGHQKTLLVEYRCVKDEVNRGRACENSALDLDCPGDTRIRVVSALYGRSHPYICSSAPHHPRGCSCLNSTSALYRMCQGKSYCTVNASNSVFGDPCVGVEKYLEVEYECVGTQLDFRSPVLSTVPENSLRNVSFYLKNVDEGSSTDFLTQIKRSEGEEWEGVLEGKDLREVQTIAGLEPGASYDLRVLHREQSSDLSCHPSVTVRTWPWIDVK